VLTRPVPKATGGRSPRSRRIVIAIQRLDEISSTDSRSPAPGTSGRSWCGHTGGYGVCPRGCGLERLRAPAATMRRIDTPNRRADSHASVERLRAGSGHSAAAIHPERRYSSVMKDANTVARTALRLHPITGSKLPRREEPLARSRSWNRSPSGDSAVAGASPRRVGSGVALGVAQTRAQRCPKEAARETRVAKTVQVSARARPRFHR